MHGAFIWSVYVLSKSFEVLFILLSILGNLFIFNELEFENSFKEKPSVQDSWINGGYFVFEPEIFQYIDKD